MAHHQPFKAEWAFLPLTSPLHDAKTCITTIVCIILMSIWAISSKNEMFRFFNRSATTTTTTTAAPGSAAAYQQPSKSWVSSKACKWLCVITWIMITLGDITFILYTIHHTEIEIFKHSTPGIVSLAVFFALVATVLTAGIQNLARHFKANEAFTSLLRFAVTFLLSITIALLYQNVPENKSVPGNENALKNAIDSAANVEKQLMALALNRSITSACVEYAWNASWAYNVDGLNSCRKLNAFCSTQVDRGSCWRRNVSWPEVDGGFIPKS